jgi:DNA-binding Lrp family transcriptional regulator
MSDGRLTNLELVKRVHLSPSACLRRVRLLEESGLIAGYVMLLDPEVAGLTPKSSNTTSSQAPRITCCVSHFATRAISSASIPIS